MCASAFGTAGLMLPILGCWKSKRETMIRERFFLGGVSSLRGFTYKGVGQRAERRATPEGSSKPGSDALGGDLIATVRGAVRRPCALHPLGFVNVRMQCESPVTLHDRTVGCPTTWWPSTMLTHHLK